MKIAINGFGRIGRLFLRQVISNPQFEVAAINDLGDLDNFVYLFKYDSVYRTFPGTVNSEKGERNYLVINGKRILFTQEKDPLKLPWKELGIDLVLESTGVFESFEKAKVHLDVGAKRVLLTAPAKDEDGVGGGRTVLMGVNDSELKLTNITSNASCTTNAASPVIAVMAESIGVEKAILNTIHAYTNTQSIVDSPVKGSDMRRGRAGAQNMIPSTTGAAIAVTRAIEELKGKFDGVAIRVPIVTGSLADITFVAKRKTTIEEINKIFREAADSPRWQGILKVVDDQIVSSDIIGEPYGAIVDLKFTKVVDGDLVKILSWYDNEWGYAAMLVKHVSKI